MQAKSKTRETSSIPLGQRRGVSDLARFALDLTWAKQRAEPGTAARPRAYPSPPMSGSPPLPPNTTQEAGERASLYSSYPAAASLHDAYRGGSVATTQGIIHGPPPHPARPIYQPEPPERLTYSYPRPDEHAPTSATFPPISGQPMHQRPPPFMPMPGPPSGPGPLPPPSQVFAGQAAQSAVEDNASLTSPKSQRKTKGHVASACVPCKKAHLRCDARRPCSRCQSNGKEDACIDVQHKKRGRPRLRNDSDSRYGASAYPHPQDAALRRPLSLYSPGAPVSGYDDPVRRTQSHRILKSQQSEPIGPRYLERASVADASLYTPRLAVATATPEPVAFLNLNLEIVKASPTFLEAVGLASVRGRTLFDIVAPPEGPKIQRHQAAMQEERGRKDPMYLPPIFGKEHVERVFDAFRFDAEELLRIPLDRHDYFVFVAADGQRRPFSVRLGSAKRDSIYFIVILLNISTGYHYSTPSPHGREVPYNWPPQASLHPQPTSQPYGHHQPMQPSFDGRQRYESTLPSRPNAGPPPQIVTGLPPNIGPGYSAGVVSGMPSYAASPSRPDYAVGPSSSQIPRSELPATSRPPPQQPQYQLPPIRSSPQKSNAPSESSARREDRSGRVDIGGLIDKPDHAPPQQ